MRTLVENSGRLVPSFPLGANCREGGRFLWQTQKCAGHNHNIDPSVLFSSRGRDLTARYSAF